MTCQMGYRRQIKSGTVAVSAPMEVRMADYSEQQIRQVAYELWEQAGKPEGSANRFWHEAEVVLRERELADRDNDARRGE